MTWKLSLDQHLAGPGAPPRAAGHLDDGLGEPLRCPEVTAEEPLVRIENDDQRDIREVMTLGDHLGAYQDPRFAGGHAANDFLHVPALAYDITIEPGKGNAWKKARQGF